MKQTLSVSVAAYVIIASYSSGIEGDHKFIGILWQLFIYLHCVTYFC